ncbi:MAG: cation transporter [Oscillospiraceae bacterium]|nr:cation transporter [Oscillospiraceae bacterium]
MRNDAFKEQEKISLMEVLIEIPYFVIVVFMAAISGSLMLMLDAFETAGVITQSGISYGLSRKLQSSGTFKYDYGMGKIESFGGLISAVFLFIGLLIVLVFSIGELIAPSEPGKALLWAVFIKIGSVALDIWLYRKQVRAAKSIESGFMQSNLINSQKVLAFDTIALVTISVTYIFRNIPYIEYIEPIICIACVVWFAYMSVKNLKVIIPDLLDKTLGETEQLQIIKCVSKIYDSIDEFEGVRTRRSGHITYIDLIVTFEDDETYAKIRSTVEKFDTAIQEILPGSVVSLIIGGA